ncbi:GDSL-type esterase/lipase family protein [Bacteroides sp.]|uniref:GDSL-type esterase/lipase family protein n=1 Tax=Bacteroides sp. TaxID=29523 RepID=UPI0025BEEF80|nr:GDSL-type esterase/lipase family protein [Bacteroides sp.]
MKHLFFLCLLGSLYISNVFAQDLNIVYVGNSITRGALLKNRETEAPPVHASHYLEKALKCRVNYRNRGVSGMTTLNYLPISNQEFPKVNAAAAELSKEKGILLFSIMLGTNDSACDVPFGAPVEPVVYYTNMKAIIDELLSLYPECKVVIHRPTWYSPNTYNSATYLAAGLKRLESYTPMIEHLVEHYAKSRPNQVFLGDTSAFDFFKNNHQTYFTPEEGNAGTFFLHPNKEGAKILGKFWAEAILKAIK